uniref:Uncharacterized protein n=1 Tax=Arundo donax TaxID=35708 RepID=A0A0A9F1F8_ARUDO
MRSPCTGSRPAVVTIHAHVALSPCTVLTIPERSNNYGTRTAISSLTQPPFVFRSTLRSSASYGFHSNIGWFSASAHFNS